MERSPKGALLRIVVVFIVLFVATGGGLYFSGLVALPQGLVPPAPPKVSAKNVIVMIADGVGYNHIAATDYFLDGRAGSQPYEQFPVKYAVSTYPAGGGYDPVLALSDFHYVISGTTDSAAAATAMATGVKTNNSAIGVDPQDQPLKNLVEVAEGMGKSTGVVTSVELSHATPAGFVAHNASRENYEEIAREMVLTSTVDVIMGAGNPWFDDNGEPRSTPDYRFVGGEGTWDGLLVGALGGDANGDGRPDPWALVQTREQFQALAKDQTPGRVIGVPEVHTTLQQARGGDKQADPFQVPRTETVPVLAEMAAAALNVLDNDPQGFFLMVEGGAMDWASADGQPGRMIEEEADFDKAVRVVIDWVERNSNWGEALLIVTADHETGYLTGPGSDPKVLPLVNNGPGEMPGMEWHSTDHVNTLVPLFAKGWLAGSFARYADQSDPVRGPYIDNTEIARLISEEMQRSGLSPEEST